MRRFLCGFEGEANHIECPIWPICASADGLQWVDSVEKVGFPKTLEY
jgi:hypothetical protein